MYVKVHGETRLTIYVTVISMFIFHLCHMLTIRHRCLQSCVGPRQDLATPHLMHNCRKRILSLHCTLYIRLCMRKHAYAI